MTPPTVVRRQHIDAGHDVVSVTSTEGANWHFRRMKQAAGCDLTTITDLGLELHDSYREMAVANGVDPEADSLRRCAR